jgi:hypothetical protein
VKIIEVTLRRETRLRRIPLPLFVLACVAILAPACAPPEDPARVELRARLKEQAVLTGEELGRVVTEVSKSIGDKPVRISQDGVAKDLDAGLRDVVLGMFESRGMYDEGLRDVGGRSVRVLSAPGISEYREYSATRRIMVDVETFLPRRFEFSYEYPGMGDYGFDLVVGS